LIWTLSRVRRSAAVNVGRGLLLVLYAAGVVVMGHEVLALPFGNNAQLPDLEQARFSIRAYARKGFPQESLKLLLPLSRQRPRDPDILLECARQLISSGSRFSAGEYLRQAGKLNLTPEQAGFSALLFQELGKNERALGILNELVRQQPRQARWRNDRGVLQLAMGRRSEAVADLSAAVAADPDLWPAYLSLGNIYQTGGRCAQARSLYDRALARPLRPTGEGPRGRLRREQDAALRRQILRQRQTLYHRCVKFDAKGGA
jgi:Flp pilus assembly protein TadD